MSQSKSHSFIEQILNVGSGYLLSLIVWTFLISELYELDTEFSENMEIVIIFTLISVVRGYFWRRFFNRKTEKQNT